MVALVQQPNPDFGRERKLSELKVLLTDRFPRLAEHLVDLGPVTHTFIDPTLHLNAQGIWLVDGEVSEPIAFNELRLIPKTTFCLQMEIIPWNIQGRTGLVWNLLGLVLAGDYEPSKVLSEIKAFTSTYDASISAHFIAHKLNLPQGYDPRIAQPSSLEQYIGVLVSLKGICCAISTGRHLGELREYFAPLL